MKRFVMVALGSALVAGCAPFEHGHYAQDVAYNNSTGDSPGTPLVYNTVWDSGRDYPASTQIANSTIPVQGSNGLTRYKQVDYAIPGYTTHTQPASYVAQSQPIVSVAPQQYAYSAPTTYSGHNYSAPVQPSYQTTASYVQPAAHSSYDRHAGHNHSVHATTYGGVQVDADGYAICDIPFPAHGVNQLPRY